MPTLAAIYATVDRKGTMAERAVPQWGGPNWVLCGELWLRSEPARDHIRLDYSPPPVSRSVEVSLAFTANRL